jgi:hypothetical protein
VRNRAIRIRIGEGILRGLRAVEVGSGSVVAKNGESEAKMGRRESIYALFNARTYWLIS